MQLGGILLEFFLPPRYCLEGVVDPDRMLQGIPHLFKVSRVCGDHGLSKPQVPRLTVLLQYSLDITQRPLGGA